LYLSPSGNSGHLFIPFPSPFDSFFVAIIGLLPMFQFFVKSPWKQDAPCPVPGFRTFMFLGYIPCSFDATAE